eukprot:TRINITY_DN72046_c0_g1_i1.p2 TRINITY_DN72046_c0_g1~~TRINITY_DN72046_c0_g1_i1.p2  ORF type:complete len:271 (-),score=57.82 TRINITY_DN72046_c0_g1_i1:166-978(-)
MPPRVARAAATSAPSRSGAAGGAAGGRSSQSGRRGVVESLVQDLAARAAVGPKGAQVWEAQARTLEALAAALRDRPNEWRTYNLASAARATVRLRVVQSPLLRAVAVAAHERQEDLRSREVAMLVWAFAHRRELLAPPALERLAQVSLRCMPQSSTQDLANTAWALATATLRHAPLEAAIAAQTRTRAPEFATVELAPTVWACARLARSTSPTSPGPWQLSASVAQQRRCQRQPRRPQPTTNWRHCGCSRCCVRGCGAAAGAFDRKSSGT